MKLLILSDSVTARSGFGRIARELASRIYTYLSDRIEVGTAGYGGTYSKKLPWPQYPFQEPVSNAWNIAELPSIYDDFADGEELTVLTIWDASRLIWFADPQYCTLPHLKQFLEQAPIKKWGYWPIDTYGYDGKLSETLMYTTSKFDRNLAYTQFGANVLDKTFNKTHEHIPHGIDVSVFRPRHYRNSLKALEKEFNQDLEGKFIIGCVATNQPRKNFSLVFRCLRKLIDDGYDARLWLHTDAVIKEWDLNALVHDMKLHGKVVVTFTLDNEELATYYSACDVTIAPGKGEGFGYPIFESIACGTPCFHANFAGAPEFFLNKEHLIEPREYEDGGAYISARPICRPEDFVDAIKKYGNIKPTLNSRLNWDNLWPEWENWLCSPLTK